MHRLTSVDITILTNVTGDILTTYSSTPNSGDLFDCSDQGSFTLMQCLVYF